MDTISLIIGSLAGLGAGIAATAVVFQRRVMPLLVRIAEATETTADDKVVSILGRGTDFLAGMGDESDG